MRALSRIVLAVSLLTSLSVFAAKMSEFKETPRSAEEIERMKQRNKYNVGKWDGDAPVDVTPFPWMAAGLAVIVILGAAPFAIKMYSSTSKEVREANSFGANPPSGGEE